MSSIYGQWYYINFVDGYSKFNWLYPLVIKSDALLVFKTFKLAIEKQTGKLIKLIQNNNGGEFTCFNVFLQEAEITHRHSCPPTHTQMGIVERQHRGIVNMGLTLLNHAKLPLKFWNHAFSIAGFIYNKT